MSANEAKPADNETATTSISNMNPTINGEPQFSLMYPLTLKIMLFKLTCIMLQKHCYFKGEAQNLTFAIISELILEKKASSPNTHNYEKAILRYI